MLEIRDEGGDPEDVHATGTVRVEHLVRDVQVAVACVVDLESAVHHPVRDD